MNFKFFRADEILGTDFLAAATLVFWINSHLFVANKSTLANLIFHICMYLISAILILGNLNRIHPYHLKLIITTALLFSISLFLPGGKYLDEYWYTFLISGIIGVFMTSIIQKPKFILFWWIIISIPISIQSLRLLRTDLSLYMGVSYAIFSVFVWLLLFTIEKFKWRYFLTLIITIISLVLIGTRGAMVSAIISIIITILVYKKNNRALNNGLVLFLGSVFILLIFTQTGINIIEDISNNLNYKSRTLFLIASHGLESSIERNEIYTYIFNKFLKNPFGLGLGGDAYLLGEAYAHNFILELLADFGLATILILMLFVKLLKKSVFTTKDENWRKVGLLFLFVTFLPKLFSSTLLHPTTLPAIAIFIQIWRNNKYTNKLTTTND